jgi:hypothetical protein
MNPRVLPALFLAGLLLVTGPAGSAAELDAQPPPRPAPRPAPRGPDAATHVPADVALYITVENVPHLIGGVSQALLAYDTEETRAAGNFLIDLGKVITGRAVMAIVFERDDPQFFFRARVDETNRKIADIVQDQFKIIMGEGNYEVGRKDGMNEVREKDGTAIFWWVVRDGVLTLSETSAHVANVLRPVPITSLTATAAYRQLAKHVDWRADLAVYADFARFPGAGRRRPRGFGPDPEWLLKEWLKLDEFRFAGVSLAGDGKTSSGRVAVLTPKARAGWAKTVDFANEPLAHADRIPDDAHLLVALTSGGDDMVGRIAALMKELDPDVAQEFGDELAEFNKELGVDLGKDLLDNLGATTVGVRLPSAGPLAVYGAIAIRDAATLQKAADALAAYNKTPLQKVTRNERVYHLLPTKPKTGYTLDANMLYYSQSFDAIESMIATKQGAPSLAESKTFAALRKRLPKEHTILAAVDAQFLARWAQTFLAMGAAGDVPISRTAASRLLGRFQQGRPGLSLGVALRTEPDAFVLHLECIGGNLWAVLGQIGTIVEKREDR